MEIRIGVSGTPRELKLEIDMSEEQLKKTLKEGLASGIVELSEKKGRTVMVPAAALGYVEIEEATPRRVGFGI